MFSLIYSKNDNLELNLTPKSQTESSISSSCCTEQSPLYYFLARALLIFAVNDILQHFSTFNLSNHSYWPSSLLCLYHFAYYLDLHCYKCV